MTELVPIDRLAQFVVVELAYLEQVHVGVCLADDLQGYLGVQDRFQADPGGDACRVEAANGVHSRLGFGRSGFPFVRCLGVEQGHCGSKGIGRAKEIQVTQGTEGSLS